VSQAQGKGEFDFTWNGRQSATLGNWAGWLEAVAPNPGERACAPRDFVGRAEQNPRAPAVSATDVSFDSRQQVKAGRGTIPPPRSALAVATYAENLLRIGWIERLDYEWITPSVRPEAARAGWDHLHDRRVIA